MLLAFMGLLLPSRLQLPSSYLVETIAAPKNGAERNRTAVRDTGVDHLVQKTGQVHCCRFFCVFWKCSMISFVFAS